MTKSKTPPEKLNRIKEVLAEKKMHLILISQNTYLTYLTVEAFCENKKQPSLEDLKEIATYLRVDIRELIEPTLPKPLPYELQVINEHITLLRQFMILCAPKKKPTAKERREQQILEVKRKFLGLQK